LNVIVEVDCRQAIPVRAIPLLTNWTTMSPDQIAKALAWHGIIWRPYKLQAYRNEDGRTQPIPQKWWKNFCKNSLQALADDLKAKEITYSTGYRDWQRASLVLLPAGSFVWKDEYESFYERAFGADGSIFTTDLGEAMPEDVQAKYVALNYDPYIPDTEIRHAVVEGFCQPHINTLAPVFATVENDVPPLEHPTKVGWNLNKPIRFPGYRKPLYDYLKKQHTAGKPCPTAREVLDAWKENLPSEVPEVVSDGLKYFDSKGNTKAADLKSIQQAIRVLIQPKAE
jgi:hypothetical protein